MADFVFSIRVAEAAPREVLWDSGADGILQAGEEFTVDGEDLWVLVDTGTAARAWVDQLLPRLPPDEAIMVTVHLVDSTGTPVSAWVSLSLSGVTITTPDEELTDETGTAVFSITPTSEGVLVVKAVSGAVESLPMLVEIAEGDDAITRLVGAVAAEKRRRARQPVPISEMSYLDVGPIAAQAPPAAGGFTPAMQPQPAQPQPGMQVLAQHLQRMVADQESKLAAEVETFRKNLQ